MIPPLDDELLNCMVPGAKITDVTMLDYRGRFNVPADMAFYEVGLYHRHGEAAALREGRNVFIFRNSFIASVFRYIAASTVYAESHDGPDEEQAKIGTALILSMLKRTQAECLYAREPGELAIVHLIECLIEGEARHVQLYEWLDENPQAAASCMLAAGFALDLILYHEVGHTIHRYDSRYFDISHDRVDEILRTQRIEVDAHLREEIDCDIFAVNSCMTRYRDRLSHESLRVQSASALLSQLTYALLLNDTESYLAENSSSYQSAVGLQDNDHHLTRYRVAWEYVATYDFDDPIFSEEAEDSVACIELHPDWIEAAMGQIGDAPDRDIRRIAKLLSDGFLSHRLRPFDHVVENIIQEFRYEHPV